MSSITLSIFTLFTSDQLLSRSTTSRKNPIPPDCINLGGGEADWL